MTEAFLKELKALEFDSLTAKEAVALRSALTEALAKADGWFADLAQGFAKPAKVANGGGIELGNGRPPAESGESSRATPPVKASKRRGRPVPNLKVDLNVNRPKPAPLAVGGADAPTAAPRPAQIFQDSYVSKEGPRPGAVLPPDHPRTLARPSSVTPEVDMADFAEAEEALKKGQLGKVFQ